jgi:hypothetical protein
MTPRGLTRYLKSTRPQPEEQRGIVGAQGGNAGAIFRFTVPR